VKERLVICNEEDTDGRARVTRYRRKPKVNDLRQTYGTMWKWPWGPIYRFTKNLMNFAKFC